MAAPAPGMTAVGGQQGRLLRARTLLLVALLALFGALTVHSAPAHAAFTFTIDEDGANDEPGQKDLTRHGVDATNLPTSLAVTWNWDTTGFSGANTGDACALFDSDDNGFIDFAVCVTINQNPAVQAATSPRVFTCGDDKVDRCTTPIFQIPSPTSSCTVAITATQPFAAGESTPNDTTATCTIQMSDVGGTNARLVNTCSFPSDNPNSDPSDCVLIIREGFLRIVKNASPNDTSAQFNFFLDGALTPVFTSNGSGTSSIIPIDTTTNPHALTETAPAGWTLSSATCSDLSPINAINVSQDETVTCTFNNVRQTGKLEVKKNLSPTTDPGKFDLQIDGTTDANADDVGHNGSTGEETLTTGTHTVGEVAGASTNLDNYQKSIECRTDNGTGAVVASVGPDSAGPLNVSVTSGSDIVCVITNTREAGKLEVKKNLSPTTDPGKFDLQIDGTTDANADDVGHNGSTGEETLNTGTHTVGEVAGASTDLANYQKSIECRADNGTGAVVASVGPDSAGPLNVSVTTGSDIVCVITNTRETGKLEVKKNLSPTTDLGKFDLQIDGTTDTNANDVGHNGSTGEETLNTGTHTVGEVAGASTDLANYQKSIECRADNGTGAVVASVGPDSAGPLNVSVTTGSDIVCVITNTREMGKLEVTKDLNPSTDDGLFNLQIDGNTDTDATDVGDGGSTGEETLDTGDHTVGESAGTSTDLDDYTKSIVCKADNGTGATVAATTGDDAGPLTVAVTTGSDIVCVITNTRETGKLEVQKNLEPSTDDGRFNLEIDGSSPDLGSQNVGDGGTTGEETLNTGDHTVGESVVVGTDLADYAKSIVCKDDNGTGTTVASTTGDSAGPLNVSVTTGSDIVCVITNTRETGKLEVQKNLEPSTDDGRFNLLIDGSSPDVGSQNVGDGGTTGEETLNTGDHTVGETAVIGTDLADYAKSIVCKDDNGTGTTVASTTSDDAGPLTVAVTTDSDIVCVITNTRETGKLEVQKNLEPSTDDGRFNLEIDGSSPDVGSQNVGDGGTTGEETLNTGDHTVGESAVVGTDLADYAKSIVCKADNGTGATVAATTTDDGGPLTVSVTTGSDIVCVITNTRETGKLEVQKDLSPSTDDGLFNLQIDGTTDTDATDVGDGGSTGEETLNTGDHTVGETAGTDTDLDDYQKSIQCRDENGTGTVVAETPVGDDAGPLTVPVTTDSDIVCVITNTRETGKLEVLKDLEPDGDDGKFDLQIDGATDTDATDVGEGGSTGEETLDTGDHTVGETAGTDTDLADYQKSIVCRDENGTGDVVAETSTDDGGPLTVPVTTDSDIVCLITNTRETGKLEVRKDLNPDTDGGRFNLQIDGTTDGNATNVGDGGSTGEETLNTGDHTVGETAGTSTSLDDYQKSIVCKDDNGTGSVVAGTSGDDGGPLTVPVTTDSDIVCTITNSRDTGKLEVKKSLSPSTDSGRFNLQIDGTTDSDATNVGDGGSTGEETLNTGNHTVGEAAGTSTNLDNYQKSIVCKDGNGTGTTVASVGTDNASLQVNVTTSSDIVCTITNTRETGKLEVQKDLNPSTDTGRFNLLIDGSSPNAGAQSVGDGGTTGEQTLNTGSHTVGESAVVGTDLAKYAKSIMCKDGNGSGTTVANTTSDDAGPLTVSVTTGSDIVCVITNTRETGKLEIRKDLEPNTDPGKFNLLIDNVVDPDAVNVGDGGSTGEQVLNTGNHTVRETAGTGTNLADYLKSIVCKGDNGTGAVVASVSGSGGALTVPVTDGSDIVCTITNTRKTGKLEVVKKVNPTTDTGRFDLRIDNIVEKDEAAHNDTTGEKTLNSGNHTVSETADGETTLTDYSSSIECKASNGTGAVVASGSGSGPVTVDVTNASDTVCTITNTRKTGKLEVVKKVNPTNDPGRFDLRIDNTVQKDEAAHNDTTGEKTLNSGNHTVSETADGETTLNDYTSSIECKASNGTGAVVASGSGSGPVTVLVTDGSDIVCTITNTRKTGKLEVVKKVNPTNDPGRFDLRIDNTVQKDEAAHNDTTGEKTLNSGNHTVSETADGETTLTDYSSSIECKGANGAGAVVASGSGTGPVTVNVTDGSDIVCTITNTRKTGKLEVVKKVNPTTDAGRFDLRIDNVVVKDEAMHDGTTGEVTLNTGNHTVSETTDFETTLADYTSTIECRAANGTGAIVAQAPGSGPLTVNVTEGSDVVCTITNTRTSTPGRMTGGGSVLGTNPPRTTHGFTLHCDKEVKPNRLEVNWSGNRWHLNLGKGDLIYATCTNDPAIAPEPPTAGFDTYAGAAYGRYNGVSGAKAEWVFTDAGEPGTADTMKIKITDVSGNVVLDISGPLVKGNHQAHK